MEGNFNKMINSDVDPFEERENSSSDNSGGSPPSTARASISSSKTRRGVEKRVVRIPIKGECTTSTTPPSDSWAWRKYGQKPIKGSPYPRGYYRCSSSKGCPARKQVERSRSEPSLLLITYSYDHNHSFPVSRNHHVSKLAAPPTNATVDTPSRIGFKIEDDIPSVHVVISNNNNNIIINHQVVDDEKLSDLSSSTGHVESLITTTDDFDWTFPHMETTSSAILDHPIFSNSTTSAAPEDDLSMRYFRPPLMAAEEESLFADLEELPECSVVFGSGYPTPAPWCGSTG